jgi:hypothetical protein
MRSTIVDRSREKKQAVLHYTLVPGAIVPSSRPHRHREQHITRRLSPEHGGTPKLSLPNQKKLSHASQGRGNIPSTQSNWYQHHRRNTNGGNGARGSAAGGDGGGSSGLAVLQWY